MSARRSFVQILAGDDEIESLFGDGADLQAILRFEEELADAEASVGLIPKDSVEAIRSACRGLEPDWPGLDRALVSDGVIVPEVIARLRAALGEPHGAYVHFGATSQDAVDTSLAMRLAETLSVFDARLGELDRKLAHLSDTLRGRPTMARTRMQRALVSHWETRLAAWSRPLTGARDGMAAARPMIAVLQFGGPVGDRRGLDGKGEAVADLLAARLGLRAVPPWHTDRTPLLAFAAVAARREVSGKCGGAGMATLSARRNATRPSGTSPGD